MNLYIFEKTQMTEVVFMSFNKKHNNNINNTYNKELTP